MMRITSSVLEPQIVYRDTIRLTLRKVKGGLTLDGIYFGEFTFDRIYFSEIGAVLLESSSDQVCSFKLLPSESHCSMCFHSKDFYIETDMVYYHFIEDNTIRICSFISSAPSVRISKWDEIESSALKTEIDSMKNP